MQIVNCMVNNLEKNHSALTEAHPVFGEVPRNDALSYNLKKIC